MDDFKAMFVTLGADAKAAADSVTDLERFKVGVPRRRRIAAAATRPRFEREQTCAGIPSLRGSPPHRRWCSAYIVRMTLEDGLESCAAYDYVPTKNYSPVVILRTRCASR
jgi:hypothetical protein